MIEERRVGLVFQDYALFPHLNVIKNISFGNKSITEEKINKALHQLDIHELKNKYPEEEYFMITSEDFDSQVRKILNVDSSKRNYDDLAKFDSGLEISHSPRVRNDIASIYYITNYDIGKTIVPIFRSYALNMVTFSSSEIFHDANDIKKLVDFENTYIPITNKMIENISEKQDSLIKNEVENTLIRDFLTIEKINQNNLFRENLLPDSGNNKVRRNGCLDRDLNLWQVSTSNFTS